MGLRKLKINNSKDAAIENGKWKNPGAKFYDTLLDSFDDSAQKSPEDTNMQFYDKFLREAYLIVGSDIKNSPYGRTPFSRSGCKYPHHVINGDELVVSIPGLKAAYSRAKQMGVYKGAVKEHLDRHFKEMGMDQYLNLKESTFIPEERIDNNFYDIESFLCEYGYPLQDDLDYYEEKSHGLLKNSFRIAYNIEDNHKLLIIYDMTGKSKERNGNMLWDSNPSNIPAKSVISNRMYHGVPGNLETQDKNWKIYKQQVSQIDTLLKSLNDKNDLDANDLRRRKELLKQKTFLQRKINDSTDNEKTLTSIRQFGDIDHSSKNLRIAAIKDTVTGSYIKVKPVNIIGPREYDCINSNWHKTHDPKDKMPPVIEIIKNDPTKSLENYPSIKVGDIDTSVNYKSTFLPKAYGNNNSQMKRYDRMIDTKRKDQSSFDRGIKLQNYYAKESSDDIMNDNILEEESHNTANKMMKNRNVKNLHNNLDDAVDRYIEIEDCPELVQLFQSILNKMLLLSHKVFDEEDDDLYRKLAIDEIHDEIKKHDEYAKDGEYEKMLPNGVLEMYKLPDGLYYTFPMYIDILINSYSQASLTIDAWFEDLIEEYNLDMTLEECKAKYSLDYFFKKMCKELDKTISKDIASKFIYDVEYNHSVDEFDGLPILSMSIASDYVRKLWNHPKVHIGSYDDSLVKKHQLNESTFQKESSDDIMNEDVFEEKSHGKLKFDFRLAYDAKSGHQIKIVYDLNNMNMNDVGIAYLTNIDKEDKDKIPPIENLTDRSSIVKSKEKYLTYAKKYIKKLGNLDHESSNQKVLAIEDLVTHEKLKSANVYPIYLIDHFGDRFGLNSRMMSLDMNKFSMMVNQSKNFIVKIKVGEIDKIPSFKSTNWFKSNNDIKTNMSDRFARISRAQMEKNGRGVKLQNMLADSPFNNDKSEALMSKFTIYKNPNKQAFVKELNVLKDVISSNLNNASPDKKDAFEKLVDVLDTHIKIIKKSKGPLNIKNIDKYRKIVDGHLASAQRHPRDLTRMMKNDILIVAHDIDLTLAKIYTSELDEYHMIDNEPLYHEDVLFEGNNIGRVSVNQDAIIPYVYGLISECESISNRMEELCEYESEYPTGDSELNEYCIDVYQECLNETFDEIRSYMNENVFEEKSHGKLKFDFRAGYDYDTGHQLKIIYGLSGINVDMGGHGYSKPEHDINSDKDYAHRSSSEVTKDVRSNISRKGNTDHSSHGQRVLAIIDRVTGKNIKDKPVTVIGIYDKNFNQYCPSGNLRCNEKELDKFHQDTPKKRFDSIKVGEIDNSRSWKSTTWFKDTGHKGPDGKNVKLNNINPDVPLRNSKGKIVYDIDDVTPLTQIAQDNILNRIAGAENMKYGRGAKVQDTVPKYMQIGDTKYQHPSKKDKRRNPELYESYESTKPTAANEYDPPLNAEQVKKKYGEDMYKRLIADPVHKWRMETGIELIHKEPTYEEFIRISRNWMAMSDDMKKKSDIKSNELFGMGNLEHYDQLISEYIKEESEWIDNYIYDDVFREAASNPKLLSNIKTPKDLLKWMDQINYGWVSKRTGKVYGTGEDDDETIFYKEYYLQSPEQLIKSKNGVCWDQTELERKWFTDNNIEHYVFYIEIDDKKNCPTHTFLVYKEKQHLCWFEHSWEMYKGIHKYPMGNDLLRDVIRKHQEANNDKTSKVILTQLLYPPKFGIGCAEFMKYCKSQKKVESLFESFTDIMNEDVFEEKSHGKLKFDFRLAYDVNTGHQLKIIYSLKSYNDQGIEVDPCIDDVGDFAIGNKGITSKESYLNYAKKNIQYRGNLDHSSSNQKVLAIIDRVDKKKLSSANVVSPIFIDNHHDEKDFHTYKIALDPKKLQDTISQYGDANTVSHITVGQIDTSSSFKSTHCFGNEKIGGYDFAWKQIVTRENKPDGRGKKIDNISGINYSIFDDPTGQQYTVRRDPNKKESIRQLHLLQINHENYLDYLSRLMKDPRYQNKRNEIRSKGERTLQNYNNIISDIEKMNDIGYHHNPQIMKKYEKLFNLPDVKKSKDPNRPMNVNESLDSEIVDIVTIPEYAIPPIDPNIAFADHKDLFTESEFEYIESLLIEEGLPMYEEDDNLDWMIDVLTESPEEDQDSAPKRTDKAESNKNGIRRKKLYMEFINWCKEYNPRNTFGSVFDKDIFHNVYPFVPEEMRYFYRLANPILCVLGGDLTFFQVSELRKLNADNQQMNQILIFAATPNDYRVFNNQDKKVYLATEENGQIKIGNALGDTFDTYIQKMINKGDILNAPIEDQTTETEYQSTE